MKVEEEMAWFSFRDILYGVRPILKALKDGHKNPGNRDLLISLIQAITETREFIETKGYCRSAAIQKLWFDVSQKARKSSLYKSGEIPDWFFTKGEFWGDPESWIVTEAADELVPSLVELEKEVLYIKGFLGM